MRVLQKPHRGWWDQKSGPGCCQIGVFRALSRCCRRNGGSMRRALKFAITSGLVVTLPFSAPVGAIELAPQVSAESLLGADVTGDSWTVAPLVRSDGAAWVFTVKTSYGDFQ